MRCSWISPFWSRRCASSCSRRAHDNGNNAGRTLRQLKILHVFPNFRVGGSQVRFAMLADVLGPDMAHTVIAIDGDYAARAIVPASARVAYAAAPTAGSLTARIMAYRNYLRVFRPDILITYNWGAIEWSLANLFLRIPHIHME